MILKKLLIILFLTTTIEISKRSLKLTSSTTLKITKPDAKSKLDINNHCTYQVPLYTTSADRLNETCNIINSEVKVVYAYRKYSYYCAMQLQDVCPSYPCAKLKPYVLSSSETYFCTCISNKNKSCYNVTDLITNDNFNCHSNDTQLEIVSNKMKIIFEIKESKKAWFDAQNDCNSRSSILMNIFDISFDSLPMGCDSWFRQTMISRSSIWLSDIMTSRRRPIKGTRQGKVTKSYTFEPSVLSFLKQLSEESDEMVEDKRGKISLILCLYLQADLAWATSDCNMTRHYLCQSVEIFEPYTETTMKQSIKFGTHQELKTSIKKMFSSAVAIDNVMNSTMSELEPHVSLQSKITIEINPSAKVTYSTQDTLTSALDVPTLAECKNDCKNVFDSSATSINDCNEDCNISTTSTTDCHDICNDSVKASDDISISGCNDTCNTSKTETPSEPTVKLAEISWENCMTGCHANNTGSCNAKNLKICNCSDGFKGSLCEIDINECFTQPCFRGKCEDRRNEYQCLCPQGWAGAKCSNKVGFSNDTIEIITTVSSNLGCSAIFVSIGFVFTVYTINRKFSVDRVLKTNSLAALLAMHILVSVGGEPYQLNSNILACNMAAISNFFFSIAHFTFLDLHARHAYYWATGVTTRLTWGYGIPWYVWIGIGWSYAFSGAMLAAAFSYHKFASSWSCWINYDTEAIKWTLALLFPAISAIINTEAVGVSSRSARQFTDKKVIAIGLSGCAGNYILVPLSFLAYFSSSYSLHDSLSLVAGTISLPANICFAISIVTFYIFCDQEVWKMTKKVWKRIRRKNVNFNNCT